METPPLASTAELSAVSDLQTTLEPPTPSSITPSPEVTDQKTPPHQESVEDRFAAFLETRKLQHEEKAKEKAEEEKAEEKAKKGVRFDNNEPANSNRRPLPKTPFPKPKTRSKKNK